MKKLVILATLYGLSSACGGCVFDQELASTINTLGSPQAGAAAVNAQAFTTAFECFASSISGAVNAGLSAGNAKGQTASLVAYTISSALCQSKYGGTTGATAAVPSSAVVTK